MKDAIENFKNKYEYSLILGANSIELILKSKLTKEGKNILKGGKRTLSLEELLSLLRTDNKCVKKYVASLERLSDLRNDTYHQGIKPPRSRAEHALVEGVKFLKDFCEKDIKFELENSTKRLFNDFININNSKKKLIPFDAINDHLDEVIKNYRKDFKKCLYHLGVAHHLLDYRMVFDILKGFLDYFDFESSEVENRTIYPVDYIPSSIEEMLGPYGEDSVNLIIPRIIFSSKNSFYFYTHELLSLEPEKISDLYYEEYETEFWVNLGSEILNLEDNGPEFYAKHNTIPTIIDYFVRDFWSHFEEEYQKVIENDKKLPKHFKKIEELCDLVDTEYPWIKKSKVKMTFS
jgi:hypothetical protein